MVSPSSFSAVFLIGDLLSIGGVIDNLKEFCFVSDKVLDHCVIIFGVYGNGWKDS